METTEQAEAVAAAKYYFDDSELSEEEVAEMLDFFGRKVASDVVCDALEELFGGFEDKVEEAEAANEEGRTESPALKSEEVLREQYESNVRQLEEQVSPLNTTRTLQRQIINVGFLL